MEQKKGDYMSFWNQFSKKVSDGAVTVSESAKRMAEIIKLNSQIDKLESEIESKYADIGKLIKRELLDKLDDDELKVMAREIDEMQNEITQKKKTVYELKGVKTCPECGIKIANEDTYCPSCGLKQEDDNTKISDDDIEIVKDGEGFVQTEE